MLFQGGGQQFFDLLRRAAENAVEVANLVNQVLTEPARYPELVPMITELESKGDRFTHELFTLINKSFFTPLEREDLAALGVSIDSVVDGMEAAVVRLGIYKITESDRFLRSFGQILKGQTSELVSAIDLVAGKRLQNIRESAFRINLLENQGDEALRSGLSTLFATAHADPVRFVTMKEIYETLEEATDRAEDVANTLEGVVMKHG